MKNAKILTRAFVAAALGMGRRSGSNGQCHRWARHILVGAMILMIGFFQQAHSAPVLLNTGQTVTGTTSSLSLLTSAITAGPNVILANDAGNLVVSIKSTAANADWGITWGTLNLNTTTYPYLQIDIASVSAGLGTSNCGMFWQDDDSTIGGTYNSWTSFGLLTPSTGPFSLVIDLTNGGTSTSGSTGWGPGTLDALRLDLFEATGNYGESFTISAVTFGSELTPFPGIAFSDLSTTNITLSSAWPTATVNTNLDTCVLVWDTTDHVPGTTNDWPSPNRLSLSVPAAGTITDQITGLDADTAYTWRFYGETATTNGWSSEKTFTTTRSSQGALATGGGVTYYSDTNGVEWCAHIFTESGTFAPVTSLEVEYLIVGGGGGGGAARANTGGGGGGAGGLLEGTANILAGATNIVVGAGGVGATSTSANGANGDPSSAFGVTAVGGGGGASTAVNVGSDGGSGGGGANGSGGSSTAAGQGNSGGDSDTLAYAGGGGGAGGAGASNAAGSAGGAGLSRNITGPSLTYATGGDGGRYDGTHGSGANGVANTGQGGGGAKTYGSSTTMNGGNGGSGIVVVRYLVPPSGTILIIR